MTGPFVPWGSTHLARPEATVDEVAGDCLGLYASPPVSHLELAARLPGYTPAVLDAAFAEHRVVGLRTLRGSGFLLPVDLVGVATSATRSRREPAFWTFLAGMLVTADYETWAERITVLLADGVARTVVEIKAALEVPAEDADGIRYVVGQMATECRIVGTNEPKSWRSGRSAFVRWEDWLPDVDPHGDLTEARAELAARYLRSWGPATAADFSWWAGLTKTQAAQALGAVANAVSDGWYSLENTETKPPRGVRLLPWWDTLFVTWRDRSRLVGDDLYPFVYDRDGNATSVVLVDGRVAGVWSLGADEDPLTITASPFERFTPRQWGHIEEEASLIGAMAGTKDVRVVKSDRSPPDLVDGRRNLFLRPLSV